MIVESFEISASCGYSGYLEKGIIRKVDNDQYVLSYYYQESSNYWANDDEIPLKFISQKTYNKICSILTKIHWEKIDGYNERLRCTDGVGSNIAIKFDNGTFVHAEEYMKGYPKGYSTDKVFKLFSKYFAKN